MNKQFTSIFVCLAALILPFSSHAVIYKHVDADGQVTYSNVKIKGGKKVNIEPADTSFGTTPKGESESRPESSTKKSTPKSFPKVDSNTQKNRDNSRKQILLSELESERKALAAAKKAYEEGAKNPETFKTANGGIGRNVPKYQKKMKSLQSDIDVHQRNVDLLGKEISSIN